MLSPKAKSPVKQEVKEAAAVLNRTIVKALKVGLYPEIEILGEADDWPEIQIREWARFPKSESRED